MLRTRNGYLDLPTGTVDYIRFGSGSRTLVMIPGVGDGLKTVKGMAMPFAILYRYLAKDFTVYVFSRRRNLAPGITTRDMAEDLNSALEALGLCQIGLVGISQDGMISQWLAIDHPEKVDKLVLAVTLSCPNATIQDSCSKRTRKHWYYRCQRGRLDRSRKGKRHLCIRRADCKF